MRKCLLILFLILTAVTIQAGMSTSRDNTKVKKSGDVMSGILRGKNFIAMENPADTDVGAENLMRMTSTYIGNSNFYGDSWRIVQIVPGGSWNTASLFFPKGVALDPIDDIYLYCNRFHVRCIYGTATEDWNFGGALLDCANKYITAADHINVNNYVGLGGNLNFPNVALKQIDTNTMAVRDVGDTVYKSFTADNITALTSVIAGTITATNIYAEDIHVASITIITQKSTETLTDYLGSENYNNVRMTDDLNLNGYSLYGGNVVDVGIQTGTTTLRSQQITNTNNIALHDTKLADVDNSTTSLQANKLDTAGGTITGSLTVQQNIINNQLLDGKWAAFSSSISVVTAMFVSGTQFDIKQKTVDGTDNGSLILSGGGAGDASRGGYLELYGNESSNGMARLYSGSGGSAYIGLHTGSGVLRQKIDNVGNFYFSPTSNQFTSTATASLWDFNNNTNTRETAIAKNIVVTTGTIGTLVITNSLISPVEYSTVTLLAVFTSTGNTTASMNTQYVDLPICFDFTPKEWECWANTAGTFTISLTTAAFGNTPVFGNSIAGTDSPSLTGTQCSSSAALSGWGGNIPQGYCLRMTVTSAATIDQVTLKVCVWKRR